MGFNADTESGRFTELARFSLADIEPRRCAGLGLSLTLSLIGSVPFSETWFPQLSVRDNHAIVHSVNIQSPSSVLSFVPGAGDTNPGASRTCCGAPALSKVHPGDTFCHQTDEKALPLEESCWHLLFKKKKKLLYN